MTQNSNQNHKWILPLNEAFCSWSMNSFNLSVSSKSNGKGSMQNYQIIKNDIKSNLTGKTISAIKETDLIVFFFCVKRKLGCWWVSGILCVCSFQVKMIVKVIIQLTTKRDRYFVSVVLKVNKFLKNKHLGAICISEFLIFGNVASPF